MSWIRQAAAASGRRLRLASLLFAPLLPVAAVRATLRGLVASVDAATDRPRQLLADVSVTSDSDAGTGIQRVVRELLMQLIANPPAGYEVRPVQAGPWRGYHYAEDFRRALAGTRAQRGPTGRVHVQAGDVFLGMDLAGVTLPRHYFALARWKAAGVRFCFIVYDLLPALHPEWFVERSVREYSAWIRMVAIFADGAACISKSVARELEQWLSDTHGRQVASAIRLDSFRLAGEISTAMPDRGHRNNLDPQVESLRRHSGKLVLMVGTVEPRKGYAQALGAFEVLWRAGREAALVIVGREGWNVDSLIKRLRDHPESGRRLLWLENASDDTLSALYRTADGLLMASEGEGFGLPIVEAAKFQRPILCRDLPVFREVAGEHARYFTASTPEDLAAAIAEWLDLVGTGTAPSSAGIGALTWRGSANQLVERIREMTANLT